MEYHLANLINPFDAAKGHPLQQEMLSLDTEGQDIKFHHFVCGRGTGKTVGVCLLCLKLAAEDAGIKILVLSPTYRKLQDNILSVWDEITPPELYSYNVQDRTITLVNGSQILLRSRSIDNPAKGRNQTRGLSVNVIVDDEAAEGFDPKTFTTALGCIRRPGKHRAYIFTTTPVINRYYQLATSDGHSLSTYVTADNPHLPADFIETARRELSEQEFKREYLAEWTDLGGRVWESFSFERWPKGNIFEFTHDRNRPFIVSCDIGSANSSYLIWQNVETDTKRLWVVTGEYHPTKSEDGSVRRMFEKIYNDYGIPMRVVAGNDMATRVATDNKTPFYFVRKIFGSIPTITPIEMQRDKQVQYDVSTALIKTGIGERRLVVASGLQSYDPDSRGILKTMELDAFSEDSKKGEFFPKGAHVKWEHARDAMLYFVVCQGNIPRMIKTNYLGNKAA